VGRGKKCSHLLVMGRDKPKTLGQASSPSRGGGVEGRLSSRIFGVGGGERVFEVIMQYKKMTIPSPLNNSTLLPNLKSIIIRVCVKRPPISLF